MTKDSVALSLMPQHKCHTLKPWERNGSPNKQYCLLLKEVKLSLQNNLRWMK